ncbi:hypothetical protein SAMN05660766_1506 [Curtobacterium sp. 314Chir4.1]|nr:hypothetical protein SAMN05660766_1506 [Curtobacterium sp. 314Chir4.1]
MPAGTAPPVRPWSGPHLPAGGTRPWWNRAYPAESGVPGRKFRGGTPVPTRYRTRFGKERAYPAASAVRGGTAMPSGTGRTSRNRAHPAEPGEPAGTGRTWSEVSWRYARSNQVSHARWERTGTPGGVGGTGRNGGAQRNRACLPGTGVPGGNGHTGRNRAYLPESGVPGRNGRTWRGRAHRTEPGVPAGIGRACQERAYLVGSFVPVRPETPGTARALGKNGRSALRRRRTRAPRASRTRRT